MNLGRMKNGRWQVRWRDTSGQQRARNFRNKLLAQDLLREIMAGVAEEETFPEMTFEAFSRRWHEDYCKVEKAESQWGTDRYVIAAYMLPAFGKKTLLALTNLDLLGVRARLKTEGRLKVKSINLIVALAKQMMETAKAWRLVRENPFSAVKLLSQPEQAFSYWTHEERDLFIERCTDKEFGDVVAFACHTGLRHGELVGLRRDCLDFKRSVVIVRRAWCKNSHKLLEHTKGKRIREVELNDVALKIAQARKAKLPTEAVFNLSTRHASRVLARLAKEAKVRPIKFHDLRHTFASHLAMGDVSIQRIQMLLGHASQTQTQRYAHLHPSALTGVTNVLVSARFGHSEGNLGSKSLKSEWGHTDSKRVGPFKLIRTKTAR